MVHCDEESQVSQTYTPGIRNLDDGCTLLGVIIMTLSGGWVHFNPKGTSMRARVRFAEREDGRLIVAEVHLEGRPALPPNAYFYLPLDQVEAWANHRGEREGLISAIAAEGAEVAQATDEWLEAVGGGEREPDMLDREPLASFLNRPRSRSLKLRITERTKRSDAFYGKVADLYTALRASGSHRPAAVIAEANDVPVTTVHRWVREARARKLLAPAQQAGKAG